LLVGGPLVVLVGIVVDVVEVNREDRNTVN
jgi:hypothetical protein